MDKDGAVQPRKFTREDIPDYSPKVHFCWLVVIDWNAGTWSKQLL